MQSETGTEREETGWRELLGPYWYKGDWLEQRAGIWNAKHERRVVVSQDMLALLMKFKSHIFLLLL